MPLLSLEHIVKDFPGVRALNDVSLTLEAGEIHALVGENGAGKSTLIKIIGAVYPFGSYGGALVVNGAPARFHGVHDSERAGIRIIHQELSLVNEMTVAENMFLGDEPVKGGFIDFAELLRNARAPLERLRCPFGPAERVGDLTVGQQQLVEIAKALSGQARVIVFDEPTAALPEKDAENLLALIEDLKRQGIGVIYISHKLNEVFRIADRITVLRNGASVSSYRRGAYGAGVIVRDMIGRSLESAFPPLASVAGGELLTIRGLTARTSDHPERPVLDGVSLCVNHGEVVGVAGLLGSGRTALLSALFGAFRGTLTGDVALDGASYRPQSPSRAIGRGVSLVTEDRKRFGLFMNADVQENLCISALSRFVRRLIINFSRALAEAKESIARLSVKAPSPAFPVANLSGGNQQKVILGRFLMTSPRLLLLDDPTRGVDVGAKYEIYKIIHSLAASGVGVLFVSSELPEVLGVTHRTYVLHDGRVRAEFRHGEADEEKVLALAAGV